MSTRVAYTNHHGFHVADARVTDYLEGVVILLAFHLAFQHLLGIDVIESHVAVGYSHGLVAALLDFNEVFQSDVEVVDFGPDSLFVGVWCTPCRHLQGHLVFIIVFSEVGTDTHKDGEILVFQGVFFVGSLGVDEHLQVFVLPQVEAGGLIDGASVTIDEVLDSHL